MTDTFNVTATLDKTTYNSGDTMTVSISGGDVLTTTTQVPSGTLTLTITAADGATTTVNVSPATISMTTSTPESVKITAITDTSGRTWTIAASGLTATATA